MKKKTILGILLLMSSMHSGSQPTPAKPSSRQESRRQAIVAREITPEECYKAIESLKRKIAEKQTDTSEDRQIITAFIKKKITEREAKRFANLQNSELVQYFNDHLSKHLLSYMVHVKITSTLKDDSCSQLTKLSLSGGKSKRTVKVTYKDKNYTVEIDPFRQFLEGNPCNYEPVQFKGEA